LISRASDLLPTLTMTADEKKQEDEVAENDCDARDSVVVGHERDHGSEASQPGYHSHPQRRRRWSFRARVSEHGV